MDVPVAAGWNRSLKDKVERHPLFTFIVLAYSISWACTLVAHSVDLGATNVFSIIMAAGPALAGSIVWAVLRHDPSGVPARSRWRLFCVLGAALVALFSIRRLWFAAGLVSVAGRIDRPIPYPTWGAAMADLAAAAVLAFLLSGVYSSRHGVRRFLRSLDPRSARLSWHWWLAAIGLYPMIVLVGNIIWAAFGRALPVPQASGAWYWLAVDAILLFLYVMIGGGGLEEPGWRGFALPLLQRRFSPLMASLLLAVIWAFWHWPLFWLGYSEGGPLAVLLYSIGAAPLAILFTAAYNHSGGSLPVVILMHSSYNITTVYLPPCTLATVLWMFLILLIVLIDRMWMKRPGG